jgi:uncharacterized protein (TIGR03086 family)
MTELLDLHARAMGHFDAVVRAIGGTQWDAPTPCADWTVRDLLNHLVVEQLWVPPLLAGASIAEVGDRFDGDRLGGDPVEVWQQASEAASSAFREDGALERDVQLSYATRRAADYCGEMTFDLTVHAWDLARGIGADDTIDPELAQFSYDLLAPQMEMVAESGIFGAPIDVPEGADIATRLLALTGRRPG